MDKFLAVLIFCYIFAALSVCGMLLVHFWRAKSPERSGRARKCGRNFRPVAIAETNVLWFDVDPPSADSSSSAA